MVKHRMGLQRVKYTAFSEFRSIADSVACCGVSAHESIVYLKQSAVGFSIFFKRSICRFRMQKVPGRNDPAGHLLIVCRCTTLTATEQAFSGRRKGLPDRPTDEPEVTQRLTNDSICEVAIPAHTELSSRRSADTQYVHDPLCGTEPDTDRVPPTMR